MIPPQTGRTPLPYQSPEARKLLRMPHPLDERDIFATDADPEIRRLGRLALRREDIDDLFALGDLCAMRSLTPDHRLLVFYVGKALIAYRRAAERARHDVDRLTAHRAINQFIDWVADSAQQHPTRRNIAVALWAAAEDDDSDEISNVREMHNETVVSLKEEHTDSGMSESEFTVGSSEINLTDAQLGSLLAAYLRPSMMQPNPLTHSMSDSLEQTQFASPTDAPELSQFSASLDADFPISDGNTIPPARIEQDNLITYGDVNEEKGESRIFGSVGNGGASETHREEDALNSLSSLENDALKRRSPGGRARRAVDPVGGEFRVGDMIDTRYEVADVRRGGMGVVYLCYDHAQREPVALKTFQSKFLENERAVARFQQEAFTWIRLEKHRHIVQARLVQNIVGRPHIILEHISGPEGLEADLRSWIEHKRLTVRHAIEFGLHIASGMQHATQRIPGLVHRDLKPANILVTHDGIAKVTDFGLVRSLDLVDLPPLIELERASRAPADERLTRVGAIIGTAPYMSPEQARSAAVDMRSDLYAFGCLIYEMLVGKHIFPVKKMEAWIHAHLHERPSFEIAAAASLPPRLQALVMACLEKDPSNRPASWTEIVNELSAIFGDVTGETPIIEINAQALEARELMDKGYSLTELGKLEEALAAYDEAISLQPDYAWAWARKGRTLRLLNRYEEAIACYNESLRIQPGYAWAWKGKGIVLERMGQPLDALECYQTATRIDPDDVWNWYNQADALQNTGRYEEAVALLKQALKLDPLHPNSWAKLGQVYRLMHDFPSALHAYQQAIDLDPTYAWAQNGYGLAMKAMGQHKEALLAFKRAARYQPDEVWHWYNLTEMLVELSQYEEAEQPAQEAVRINPEHAYSWAKLGQVLRYLKRYEDALAAYDRAIRLQPDYAWAINGKGIVLEQLERYEEALEAYNQASRLGRGDVWHYYNQGNVLALLGRYEEALPLLRSAVELNPPHARSWARLGNVLRNLGKYEEAIEAYRHAVESEATYAWAWNELGMTYEALGRIDAALDAYRHAADSDSTDPYYLYQQVDLLTGRSDHAAALSLLETALKRDSRNSRTWAKHGQVLRRLNRLQDSLRSYARAIELDPQNAWAWNGRGLVLSALNQHEEALSAFRKASAIDPRDAWYWYNQGDELVSLNRFREALEALEQAIKFNPSHAESWAKRGQSLRRLNRPQDALTAYDRALALSPRYAWAWNGRGLTLESLGRREEAIASYEQALAEDGHVIWYYTNQVDLLLEMRRETQALAVVERALEVLPENAIAWSRKGQVLRRLRAFEDALEAYETALTRDSQYGWAWNGKGLAYAALSRWEEARVCYENAVKYNPNDAWFWHNVGEACLNLDDCPNAVIAFEKALSIDPGHQQSRNKLLQARACVELRDKFIQ